MLVLPWRGPGVVGKLIERKIFSLIAEAKGVVWNIRDEVLFKYAGKFVKNVASLYGQIAWRGALLWYYK